MTDQTPVEIAKRLLELAKSAVDGPWLLEELAPNVMLPEGGLVCEARAVSDARYIAACSPDLITALCQRLLECERDAERYRWLRYRNGSQELPEMLTGVALDRHIDAAIASQGERE